MADLETGRKEVSEAESYELEQPGFVVMVLIRKGKDIYLTTLDLLEVAVSAFHRRLENAGHQTIIPSVRSSATPPRSGNNIYGLHFLGEVHGLRKKQPLIMIEA